MRGKEKKKEKKIIALNHPPYVFLPRLEENRVWEGGVREEGGRLRAKDALSNKDRVNEEF